jgi:hypothetical protein
MLRAAVLWTVIAALALGGCGDDGSSDGGESTPTATATPESRDYYRAMGKLVSRLDHAVAAAIAGEPNAARDYAGSGARQALQLVRDVPIVEARDFLKSEAG